ncbi:Hsp20/alpha crystallin family protein [Plantactinospora sp. ZYX-F-223]|uniref:Hsp20/alpha crystallin family protein n=1 Tax=Plantactinospora sp. ZYX-F-223 TaxID=3144103 RepID=UPI0031FDD9C9
MSTLSLWTRRDPFAEFDALVRNAFGTTTGWPTARSTGFTPPAEIVRDGADAVVRVELPGVDVEQDVTVEVDSGRLVVRGERRDERAEERDGRSLREVRYGSFRRAFRLPAHLTADAVTASYEAGVLQVRVAGAYADGTGGARRIAVTSGSPATSALGSGEAQPTA